MTALSQKFGILMFVLIIAFITVGNATKDNGCSCFNHGESTCDCCWLIYQDLYYIKIKGCVNIGPSKFMVSLDINDIVKISTATATNDLKVCVSVPQYNFGSICIYFYNLNMFNFIISGCADLRVSLLKLEMEYHLGCWKHELQLLEFAYNTLKSAQDQLL